MNQSTITNTVFLKAIFGNQWEQAHIASFPDDPNAIVPARRALCWAGGHARYKTTNDDWNNYFTISLFNGFKRSKNIFKSTHVIVADDVKEKIPEERAKMLPIPSYKLRTSAGSEQWGWILDEPCTSRDMVDNLLDGLVSEGLSPSGKDPGMKGVTRYVRLPNACNTKASRMIDGKHFRCELLEWNEVTTCMSELASCFNIDLWAKRTESVENYAQLNDHPIFGVVNITGVNGEWTQIDCPNAEAHSSADASGAAVRTLADGQIEFMCHHGACGGEAGVPKVTGKLVIELLGITEEYKAYIRAIDMKGTEALKKVLVKKEPFIPIESNIRAIDDNRDDLNVYRFVYLPVEDKYFDVLDGSILKSQAINKMFKAAYPGGKERPLATNVFDEQKDVKLCEAKGVGWLPTGITKPTREKLIYDNKVNTWPGLKVMPKEGDVSLWLEHAEYLIPDARQREVALDYLASLFQQLDVKPSFAILQIGDHRNGKDMFLSPIMKIFGNESASATSIDNIINGWGDYLVKKKFLVITEVDSNNRNMSNRLKTLFASGADQYVKLNLKGGQVINQYDCTASFMMSNLDQPLHIAEGDKRYFVIESKVAPKDAAYYTKLGGWLSLESSQAAILNYLLCRKININIKALPYMTDAAKRIERKSEYGYEQDLRTIYDEGGFFDRKYFTLKDLKELCRTEGIEGHRNGWERTIEKFGYSRLRGIKKIEGKVDNTPWIFVHKDNLDKDARAKEVYEYYTATKSVFC
jgi:hypothetical protein